MSKISVSKHDRQPYLSAMSVRLILLITLPALSAMSVALILLITLPALLVISVRLMSRTTIYLGVSFIDLANADEEVANHSMRKGVIITCWRTPSIH